MRSKRLVFVACVVLLTVTANAFADTPSSALPEQFTLGSVVQLQRNGMTDEDVTLIIRNMPAGRVSFDTSPQGLMVMKEIGFSNQLIAAIQEKSGPTTPPADTNGWRAVEPETATIPVSSGPTVTQNGQTLELTPTNGYNTFVPGKDSPMKVLAGAGASSMLGAGAFGAGASGALGAAGPAAMLAGPVIGLVGLHRAKTIRGYEFELLPGTSSTTPITSAPAEFAIPYSAFGDNRYRVAEPHLFRLMVNAESRTRVLGTAEGSLKHKQLSNQTSDKKLEPFEREEVPAEFGKNADGVTLALPAIAPGEYAIVFLYDDETLDNSIDFSVR